jgi:hypothetical protein
MDDWALATVSDLEDRTRVRGVGGVVPTARGRRRRKPVASTYSPVGTMMRQTAGGQPKGALQSSGTRPVVHSRGMQALAWSLVATAVLVIALGATATLVLIRANSDSIPQVTDIVSTAGKGSIKFSWTDPGLKADDSYQVTTSDGRIALQTATDYFAQDAKAGDRVCITVAVNRQGKTGPESAEKCVDFGG